MSKNCHKQISRHRYKSPKLKQEQQQRNTFRLSVAKQKKTVMTTNNQHKGKYHKG